MATNYTTLLGLALPTQGELSGTWGDTVNNYITQYLDAAISGAQSITTDANVTLTKTTGSSLTTTSSQYAILNCTGARTAERTITAPAASKIYVIINATTGGFGVKIVGAGPTTGIVVPNGTRMMVAWNGTDFVVVAESQIDLTTDVTGALPVGNGGTGATTFTSGGILRGNGTSAVSVASASDITTAIGSTAVTNATNATNLTGSGTISSTATGTTKSFGTSDTTMATTAFVDALRDVVANSQSTSYTLALTDRGKSIDYTGAGSHTITIPANGTVAFPVGSTITITNTTANNLSIAITTDTLRQAGTANTGTRTLAQYGVATIRKVASTVWIISGSGLT